MSSSSAKVRDTSDRIREPTAISSADGSENVYVVTCFSDRDKILSQVVKEA